MTRGGPIRFCMLTTFYPPWNFGGDGIHVERLAHTLVDGGHSVTVVCSPAAHRLFTRERPPPPPDRPGLEIVTLDDNPVSLTARYLSGRPVGATRALRELLGRDFDVLHFHNPSLLGAPALLGMGDGLKLYTAHEQWLLCPSHLLMRRNGRVCEDPPCLSCELAHRRPPQPWRRTGLLERSLRHLDALIAPSQTTADLHRRFADVVPIEVLPHFAPDPGSPAARERGGWVPSEGRPYFLYVGRLEPVKGVETLIEAFRRRRSEDLVIAGDGDLAKRLRGKAADLPHVRFTGWLPEGELDGLYRGALALVVPTVGHEVLPLVVLEAFARGTPVLARRFGVLEELATSTGAAITYGSEPELDLALERIATEPQLREQLSERGLAAQRERFSVQAHLGAYMSLVSRLASGRGEAELARAAAAEGAPSRGAA